MALSIQQQTFQCTSCPRSFTTGRGLARHQVAHNRHEESASTTTKTASSIISADTTAIDYVIRANLPPFLPDNPIHKTGIQHPRCNLANPINAIYEDIITWRKNYFSILSRQQGKKSHTALIRMVDISTPHFKGVL